MLHIIIIVIIIIIIIIMITICHNTIYLTATESSFVSGPGYGLVSYLLPAPNYRESYHLKFGIDR